jgi:integrase
MKPKTSPYFIRDNRFKGFAVKVNTSGSIKFIAEVWHNGRSIRKTLGEYPIISIPEARQSAISFTNKAKEGTPNEKKKQLTFIELFEQYMDCAKLKPNTIKNYRHVILFYLSDCLSKPVSSISKQMVEKRFYQIRDKCINGRNPTLWQAVASMRYLSALMNYAMADDLIQSNPVDILQQKRIDRTTRKREHYLSAQKVRELLDISASEVHPVTLAVHLMLYTDLRKTEALRLMWCDIQEVEGIMCIIIADTKNHRPHYIPVTPTIQEILCRCKDVPRDS